ncbi:MAG: ScpA family protein [Acidobacteriota bacterium]
MVEIVEEINLFDTKEPRYSLPVFEGPLDLLLYLIDRNELDIYDIPISLITRQYNQYISRMKELNLYIAADFINMAATLIYIKSQMLLPKSALSVEQEEEDPREILVKQLVEHKKFLEIGQMLGEKEALTSNQFYRTLTPSEENSLAVYDVGVWDLVTSLKEIVRRAEDRGKKIILIDEKNLNEKIDEIMEFLKEKKSAVFDELLKEITRSEMVITFLALLELARKRAVVLFQEIPFSPIRVAKK